MTVVSMLSLKGSPGVTTLACLVAAAWPGPGSAVVVEADPAGGDLAARFGLSSRTGWPSLSSSTRRSGDAPCVDPHLQELPGGLPVLVGARGSDRRSAHSPEGSILRSAQVGGGPPGLTLVDLGRFGEGDDISDSWLDASDAVVLVVRGDACGVVQVHERAEDLIRSGDGRLGIVVVGGGRYGCRQVSEFTGIAPLGEIPFDPSAAGVASGASSAGHRLERSLLWIAAGRLAMAVATLIESGRPAGEHPDDAEKTQGSVTPHPPLSAASPAARRSRAARFLGMAGRNRGGDRGSGGRTGRDGRREDREGPAMSGSSHELAPVVAEAYVEATGRADA